MVKRYTYILLKKKFSSCLESSPYISFPLLDYTFVTQRPQCGFNVLLCFQPNKCCLRKYISFDITKNNPKFSYARIFRQLKVVSCWNSRNSLAKLCPRECLWFYVGELILLFHNCVVDYYKNPSVLPTWITKSRLWQSRTSWDWQQQHSDYILKVSLKL